MITELLFSAILALTTPVNDTNKVPQTSTSLSVITNYNAKSPLVYSSGWETISTWNSTINGSQIGYSYSTQLKSSNDIVLVFIKGYDFEGFSKSAAKPLGMPFYTMPSSEGSFNAFAWSSNTNGNNLNIQLNMAQDLQAIFTAAKQKVEFRYFAVSKELLKTKGITEQELRKTSYSSLVSLLGVQD